MKITKHFVTYLSLAFIFCCSSAMALDTFDVKKAIDKTISYLENAVAAYDKNNNNKEVIEMLIEAKQVQKSISSANGQLSMIKTKATQKLVQARSHFNDGDVKAGGEAMKEALAGFKDLKEKYDAAH